jgi:hypothetical protein
MSLYDPYNGQQTTCKACGVSQDMRNGIARGACAVCHVGYLTGWYVPRERLTCRYKGCGQPAVAADGKWPVCKPHLAKRRPDLVCVAT